MGRHPISSKRKAVKAVPCVLVLWGEYFDEIAATIFIGTLRQAGLAVRVVGVHGLLAAGRNGLLLHADLSLSEVKPLLEHVACLVLPCSRATVKRLENDPRVHELIAGVVHHGAKLIVHDRGVIRHSVLHSLVVTDDDIVAYAQNNNLLTFAQEMAKGLAPIIARIPARYPHA